MNTLRMKLTPRPESGLTEVTWYSCPQIKSTTEKTVAHIQRIADSRGVAVDYSICSDMEYFACRAARMWLLTEPGDHNADHEFRVALVRAGILTNTNESVMLICGVEDDFTVKIIKRSPAVALNETITINVKTGEILIDQMARAITEQKGPVDGYVSRQYEHGPDGIVPDLE